MDKETLNVIALSLVKGIGSNALPLYQKAGSATAIMENHSHIRDIFPESNAKLIEAFTNVDYALRRAEQEMELMSRKSLRAIAFDDDDYPQRLRECLDAPLLLYYCGNADLNKQHVLSMVGTRKCTNYGRDLCRSFVAQMKEIVPDCQIISGLAYGIDICSHREALANGMETIGVLAHGLEKIYPYVHRQTAIEMTRQGGLLTEYITGSEIEKGNFVRRNRIVAGMSDATIVVESAAKGGSLITANIANSYSRDVFAFPGRITDEQSAGCNRLIHSNAALSVQNAEEVAKALGWICESSHRQVPRQQELFVELTPEEQKVVDSLTNCDDKQIGFIVNETGLSFNQISVIMFELEMKGLVAVLGGARYRLIGY